MVATKIKQMLSDDAGVSPVIGVILMVAVTVVLAAVIGAFVFGIGDSLGEPAPNAQIGFDYDSDNTQLEVFHDGGDAITGENTGALILDHEGTLNADAWAFGDAGADQDDDRSVIGDGDSASAGTDLVTVDDVESGDETVLYWESPGGDQSSSLGTHEAP